MSRILHLVNMGLRYGRSKGARETRQEEPPLGILAVPCHLEEIASHHSSFGSHGAEIRRPKSVCLNCFLFEIKDSSISSSTEVTSD